MGNEDALLLVLQHADSAFPSGGFAFSQGLEGYAALAGRPELAGLESFLRTQIRLRWASADRIALIRAHRTGGDLEAISEIDAEIEAVTLPEPLRSGSRRNGAAFLATHARLGVAAATAYRARIRQGRGHGHLLAMQGLVWSTLGVGEAEAAAVSGYQFAAAMIQAAVRLGLTGAIDAQRVLAELRPEIAAAVERPVPRDADIESYTPLADIAAMRHARQESRLFAN
ncbi:urease accessory protein UreF [Microbaculum marinum]|uniref:Urease accessory protein UreF n=1 Tax=Microbaculum marinum TaxID=1764581 RepID=A0AAW9RMK5_9HYPH